MNLIKTNFLTYIITAILLIATVNVSAQWQVVATGSANNFTLNNYPANFSTYTPGISVTFKSNQTITGPATLNINSLGAISIKKHVNVDLAANDILAGQFVTVIYDNVSGVFQMVTLPGSTPPSMGSGTPDYLTKWDPLGTSLGNSQVFNNATGVGISNNSPAGKLHIFENAGSRLVLDGDGANVNGSNRLDFTTGGNNSSTSNVGGVSGWQLRSFSTLYTNPARQNDFQFSFYDGSAYTQVMHFDYTGKVGVGTLLPSERLHVAGALRLDSAFKPNNQAGTSGQILSSQGPFLAPTWINPSSLGYWTKTGGVVHPSTLSDNVSLGHNGDEGYALDIRKSGDAMINMSSSGAALGTSAGLRLSMFDGYVGMQYTIAAEKSDATAGSGSSDLIFKSHYSTAGGTINNMVIRGENTIFNESNNSGFSYGNVLVPNGNVGIGSLTATEKLDVTGNVKFTGELMPSGNGGLVGYVLQSNGPGLSPSWIDPNTSGSWTRTPTGTAYPTNVNDSVSIGTTTGYAKLAVYGNSIAPTSATISQAARSAGVQRYAFSSGDVFDIGFQTSPTYSAWMQAGYNGSPEAIILNPLGGNIGIGNSSPAQALDVAGAIQFNSSLMPSGNAGVAGQVLQSNGPGMAPSWNNTTPPPSYTASNGLNVTGTDFKLGGLLTQATSITHGAYTLTHQLTGTGDFDILAGGSSKFYVANTGQIGMGTTAPARSFHLSTTGTTYQRITGLSGAYLEFQNSSAGKDDWSVYNWDGTLRVGRSTDDFASLTDLYIFHATNFSSFSDNTRDLGNTITRWRDIYTYDVTATNDYNYAAAKTRYYSVSPKSFTAGDPNNDRWYNGNFIYSYFNIASSTNPAAVAGINLPDGAVITQVEAYVWDNDLTLTNQTFIGLYKTNISGGYTTIGIATLAADAASVQTLSVNTNHTVNNSTGSYYLRYENNGASGNFRLYGFRITYTVTKAD